MPYLNKLQMIMFNLFSLSLILWNDYVIKQRNKILITLLWMLFSFLLKETISDYLNKIEYELLILSEEARNHWSIGNVQNPLKSASILIITYFLDAIIQNIVYRIYIVINRNFEAYTKRLSN